MTEIERARYDYRAAQRGRPGTDIARAGQALVAAYKAAFPGAMMGYHSGEVRPIVDVDDDVAAVVADFILPAPSGEVMAAIQTWQNHVEDRLGKVVIYLAARNILRAVEEAGGIAMNWSPEAPDTGRPSSKYNSDRQFNQVRD